MFSDQKMSYISPHLTPTGKNNPVTFFDKVRRFDFNPKTKEDYKIRSVYGGLITLISFVWGSYLFFNEVSLNLKTDLYDHLYMNSSRSSEIEFSFNVTFPHIHCKLLSADVLDHLGNQQDHLTSHIIKTRVDSVDGSKIEGTEKTRHRLGSTFKSEEAIIEHHTEEKVEEKGDQEKSKEEMELDAGCGNCYGAGEEGQCCNTCNDVRIAYARKGWAFIGVNVIQCQREEAAMKQKTFDLTEDELNYEGCNIQGSVILTKESGNLHFAPGEELKHRTTMRVEDLLTFTFMEFNMSHTIHYINLGPDYPGFHSPLNRAKRTVSDGYGMYQYYLKLVPTIYRFLSGKEIHTNQYSVTEHLRHVDPGSGRGLPGVFFFYDTSPLHVEIVERRKGLISLMTSLCALVGGIYTMMGFLERIIFSLDKKLTQFRF